MASSGLNRLRDSVHVSSGNLITVATPEGLLSCEQTIEAPSIARVFCSQMDATCFNQLSEAAMSYLHLAYYRNQLLHLFVKDSMLALCLTPESDYGVYVLLQRVAMVCMCYSREWLWCVCVTPESGYGVYVLLQRVAMVCMCYSREWLWCVCVTPESGYGVCVFSREWLWCVCATPESVCVMVCCMAKCY